MNIVLRIARRMTAGARPILAAAAVALALLTLTSLLPLDPQGPFDARDFSRLPGMRLVRVAGWETPVEPLVAPLHILLGAPDLRLAIASTLVWTALVAGGLRLWRHRRTAPRPSPFRAVVDSLAWAASACLVMALWLGALILWNVPGWRLVVDDPDSVVADFQSHTSASHDGIGSLQDSLRWHKAAGFNVVAVTEHHKTAGPFLPPPAAVAAAERGEGVIPGLEVRSKLRPNLLALGFAPGTRTLSIPKLSRRGFAFRFVAMIRNEQQGAVIASTTDMEVGDEAWLAEAGVDGFELPCLGHPPLTKAVRRAVLEEARTHGLPLVVSTDRHGWSGVCRLWTVVRIPGASAMSGREKAESVVRKIRNHEVADFIPVTAGYMGRPSWLRVVFAPVFETARYAAELNAAGVLAWWAWAGAAAGAWLGIRRWRRGVRAGRG